MTPSGIPTPIALLVVGAVLSFVPGIPEVRLSSELVLYGLLPPLLYAAALSTSLLDVRAQRGAILSLSVGLVLFTAAGVGLVAWLLLPISFALALALGAIVAPPDAVAATAVARRIGLPRRITTILEGESLLNDATALVTLRTTLAAAGLVAHGVGSSGEHAPEVTVASVGIDLLIASVGGVAIGVLAFLFIGLLRKHLTQVPADTALSFVAPYLAYVPAEQVGASGVLAVVTAGLLLAHKAPIIQTAPSRLSERINWSSITFVLENSVFLLIGLQIAGLLDDVVNDDELSTGRTLVVGLVVLVTCLVLRPVWMIPFTLLSAGAPTPPSTARTGCGEAWSVRGPACAGVVTLAAALTLPEETPLRAQLVVIALVVTVGTLMLQGSTLPWLARRLDVRGPDPREDALQEATVLGATTGAGLRLIEADPRPTRRPWPPSATRRPPGSTAAGSGWAPSAPATRRPRARPRQGAHRDDPRGAGRAAPHPRPRRGRPRGAHPVLGQLDAEESALIWNATRPGTVRASPLRPPDRIAGACEHLAAAETPKAPTTAEGCPTCLAEGLTWVHLRSCAVCGQVGCCDSSIGKHAEAHFHETGHPVMRSIEPGEAWRWCYVDEVLG